MITSVSTHHCSLVSIYMVAKNAPVVGHAALKLLHGHDATSLSCATFEVSVSLVRPTTWQHLHRKWAQLVQNPHIAYLKAQVTHSRDRELLDRKSRRYEDVPIWCARPAGATKLRILGESEIGFAETPRHHNLTEDASQVGIGASKTNHGIGKWAKHFPKRKPLPAWKQKLSQSLGHK